MLTAEPATPARNAIFNHEKPDFSLPLGLKLSLQGELDFVENMAFIYTTSENPENVIALCVEEQLQSTSCTFRFAIDAKLPMRLLGWHVRDSARA